MTLTAGFGAIGYLNESGINGLATTFNGLGFTQYGVAAGGVTTGTSGQFSYTDNLNLSLPANAGFLNKNIYLLVGFGGTSLATSTELFIYKFSATFGAAESGLPITQTLTDPATPGTQLFGTTTGGNPQSVAAARYVAAAITAEPVPETSTTLLGAIGALALLRRRRN